MRRRLSAAEKFSWEQIADFDDHPKFCRECLEIRNKHGRSVPFELGPAQLRLSRTIAGLKEAGKPIRIIALKARQVWMSTGFAGHVFHQVPWEFGQQALIVAHAKDAAANIFGYYSQFHHSYRAGLTERPASTAFSQDAEGGYIRYTTGSSVRVATAKNVKVGRSFSFRYLHLSEFAFWDHPKVVMDALMQTVPDDPEPMVLIESTANGMGNEFHKIWRRATDPLDTDCEWVPIFFAWWEHPEYERALPVPQCEFQQSLDEEERTLIARYNVSPQKLAWRRWKIANAFNGSLDGFHQEYPSNPEEAFLASGRPRFDQQALARMPVRDGLRIELTRQRVGARERIIRTPSEHSPLIEYVPPKARHRYVAGVDTATGSDTAAVAGKSIPGSEDPDWSVCSVFDIDTWEQCAVMRERAPPGEFADLTEVLLAYYGMAYVVPEVNAEGLAYLEALLRLSYPPGRIYHRTPMADEQFSTKQEMRDKLGWKTTPATRPQLISTLDNLIREMGIYLYDQQTVSECQSFVYKPNGRVEHADGAHDDCVFAAGLAVKGILGAPADRRLNDVIGGKRRRRGPTPLGGRRKTDERGAVVKW
jgi:hypothetical protein